MKAIEIDEIFIVRQSDLNINRNINSFQTSLSLEPRFGTVLNRDNLKKSMEASWYFNEENEGRIIEKEPDAISNLWNHLKDANNEIVMEKFLSIMNEYFILHKKQKERDENPIYDDVIYIRNEENWDAILYGGESAEESAEELVQEISEESNEELKYVKKEGEALEAFLQAAQSEESDYIRYSRMEDEEAFLQAVENSYREPTKEKLPNPYDEEMLDFREKTAFGQVESLLDHIENNFDISEPFELIDI